MKQTVSCPKCGSRLMDAETGVTTQTKEIRSNDPGPPKERWIPDYYIKCWKCGSNIGYRKIPK